MKPRHVPTMTSDEEAEHFLDEDLSELDYSQFKPIDDGGERRRLSVNSLIEALKAAAERERIQPLEVASRVIASMNELASPGNEDDMSEISVAEYVGRRILHRRLMIGLTQKSLGGAVGVSAQVIQRYEKGIARVAATRLWAISQALSVDISYFFQDIREQADIVPPAGKLGLLEDREALDLVRSYYAIPERDRKRLFDLARDLKGAA